MKAKCVFCQKDFKKRNYYHLFCSSTCRNKYEWENRLKKDLELIKCKNCGENFHKKSADNIFCSRKCLQSFNNKINYVPEKRNRFKVLVRDGFKCVYCGRGVTDGITLQVDHVKAKFNQGGNNLSNLVTSCNECNIGKSNLDYQEVEEYVQRFTQKT